MVSMELNVRIYQAAYRYLEHIKPGIIQLKELIEYLISTVGKQGEATWSEENR